jgi:hypothetical protein
MNEHQKQTATAAQGRQRAETAQQTAEKGAQRIKDIADEAAHARQNAVNVTADAAQVGAETMQETLQVGLDAASKVAQRSTDQFMQVLGLSGQQSQELVQQSTQNIQAIANTSTVLARGFQNIVREWLNFTQSRFDQNLDRLNDLTTCRSIPDLVALQSNLIRENMEEMIDKGHEIMQRSTEVTREAARSITSQSRTGGPSRG